MRRNPLPGLLRRYGRPVALGDGRTGMAFVQPILERSERSDQVLPTPLGRRRADRFLYLGAAELPLRWGDRLRCGEECYRVCSAQAVYMGGAVSHWWGMLRPEEG